MTPVTVFGENKWRLLRYAGAGDDARSPIVVVPSLINRHYILDLLPERGLLTYLAEQGHDVYVVDWGTPGPEDRFVDFDTVCDRYLSRIVRVACRGSGAKQAHLLGYCMGGTLAAIFAARRPKRVASLCTLAAPIDFDHAGMLGDWVRTGSFGLDALVDGTGLIPWRLMQAAFHLIRPTLPLAKLVRVAGAATDAEFQRGFWATERWGADNVSLPGEFYRHYIRALYRDNALVRGQLVVRGEAVKLADIQCPVCVVTFDDDPIVPTACATALVDAVGTPDVLHIARRGGHVGGVVSRRAQASLWPQLHAWFHRPAEAAAA
ncbi:MAG: alpha/beta fold hydrolase [Myxococcota bacterium]